jgi:hypothetical protein
MNALLPVGIALLAASGLLLFYCTPRGGRVKFPMTIPIVEYLMPVLILVGLAVGAVLTAVGSGLLR